MQNSTVTQLRVFKELCGEHSYGKVTLGTTCWEKIGFVEGEAREQELYSNATFLADMKELEARSASVKQDRTSCLTLIEAYAGKDGSAMKAQVNLDKTGTTFDTLGATAALSLELEKLRIEQELKQKEIQDQEAGQERRNAARLKIEEEMKRAQLKQK